MRKGESERLRGLARVTEPVSGRAGTSETQAPPPCQAACPQALVPPFGGRGAGLRGWVGGSAGGRALGSGCNAAASRHQLQTWEGREEAQSAKAKPGPELCC